jgi:hypothetical protein
LLQVCFIFIYINLSIHAEWWMINNRN